MQTKTELSLKDLMNILDESITNPNTITQYLNQNERIYKSISDRESKNGETV